MQALSNPLMDRVIPYPVRMAAKGSKDEESTASDTAKVLGANLTALMASNGDLNSNPKVSKKTGLGTGSVSRLRNGDVDANLSTLEKIAKAFELQPWQLLVHGLDPGNLPALLAATETERLLWERLKAMAKELQGGG